MGQVDCGETVELGNDTEKCPAQRKNSAVQHWTAICFSLENKEGPSLRNLLTRIDLLYWGHSTQRT